MKLFQEITALLIAVAIVSGIVFISSCTGPAAKKEVELIPRDLLIGNPEKASPRISPDGRLMAYRAPVNEVMNVWVKTIGQEDDKPVTKDDNRGIRRYFWAEDSKHIMYLQDVGGDENWRLYDVSLKDDEIRDLTPYEKVQVQIVDRSKHYPNDLIIAMNKDNPELHDVYHMDLTTGELELVAKNPGNIVGWVTDYDMKVRAAQAANAEGGFDLLIRDSEGDDFRQLLSWGPDDALNSGPISFTKDGKSLILIDSRDANTSRLVILNIESGEKEVVAEDPQYDVSNVEIHPDTYEIQAVGFTKDREEWKILDESIRPDFSAIAKLHRGDFNVFDRDNADATWLVGFSADNGPIAYYAWDRESQNATFLFYHRSDLLEYKLANMEPISFKSRDGYTIHGYITYPPGSNRKNLPLVLNVHGGPWHRITWGLDVEAQWLANRGYACLQVNFRGSTGYGKDFLNAGNKEWGGKMHDDLVDAVQWAIDTGIADPEKVAIYGGSYGGYAALVGATFTPELFCCAVDIVGPSNLISFINTVPPYWKTFLEIMYQRVGNPQTEEEFLKSRSPLFSVDNIQIPMLIAQGANDPRVKQAESEQIVDAMDKKGIEYDYLLFPDEGHGFAKPENRLAFYAAAEEFLSKNLGGRLEPLDEETLNKLETLRPMKHEQTEEMSSQ